MPDPGARRRAAPIIAIDGPVGAGKSTVAMAVAAALRYRYVDTGAMYRSVAWLAKSQGVDLRNERAVATLARSVSIEFVTANGRPRILVNGTDVTDIIRSPEVSHAASVVSAHPAVREGLVAEQRRLGASGGVVMEGRDIGTVVFPDADVKVFLDASPAERARRRYQELVAKGVRVDFESLKRAEEERDRRDTTRAHSPLRRAEDAVVIDTTGLTVEEIVNRIVQLARPPR
ncbi:MAG: (d)CMP kinase [Armatimonadetes bacterium]|nr:(d)CMP kinase [Armatimonadota bacterium]